MNFRLRRKASDKQTFFVSVKEECTGESVGMESLSNIATCMCKVINSHEIYNLIKAINLILL